MLSMAAPPPSPPWTELPDDLTANILQRLDAEEIIMNAMLVCSTWWRVCKNPAMWRVIDLIQRSCSATNICCCGLPKLGRICCCAANRFWNICRFAMDRSEGQLVELKLDCFEMHGFLNYIAHRSSQLRRLTLKSYDTTMTDVNEALKKRPQLEELHLITKLRLSPDDFETIGFACPLLKSLAYTNSWISNDEYISIKIRSRTSRCYDDIGFSHQAVSIGKTMPNLRHLRLSGYFCLGSKGLEAILDGCPHLQLLHLGEFSGFLRSALYKRCYEQIKDLRFDSKSFVL